MMIHMSIVLHIGAPKTGTTAVQTALAGLDRQGAGLAGYGVAMPGGPLEQAHAALSVLQQGFGWRKDGPVTSPEHWPRLARQARTAEARTVFISSEYLCEAEPPVIGRILDDLGDDVRVILTLRPLSRMLPSAWQQYLKSGHQLPYPEWLKAVLATPPKRTVTPSFWRRHDQAAVTQRWADAVGADRMTVAVLDPADRRLLFRTFENALRLPEGSLRPGSCARGNRSMTAAEAELFRRVNTVLRRKELPWPDYAHLIRYGAILRTVENRVPGADAGQLVTPGWALDRAEMLGQEYAGKITARQGEGLTVVGDLGQLADRPPTPPDPPVAPDLIPVEVAVEALLGAVSRAAYGTAFFADEQPGGADGLDPEGIKLPGAGRGPLGSLPLDRITTQQLGGVLAERIRAGVDRRRRNTVASSAQAARSSLARVRKVAGLPRDD